MAASWVFLASSPPRKEITYGIILNFSSKKRNHLWNNPSRIIFDFIILLE
jgi:hypothetical protein